MFTGINCEKYISVCRPDLCANNGTCTESPSGYACTCAVGYTGTNCQTVINLCASYPCINGGTCFPLVNGYQCYCPQNYGGKNCQNNLDGTCKSSNQTFICLCPSGRTGTFCEKTVNECQSGLCQNNAICVPLAPYGFQCICLPGYTGSYCEVSVDPCATNPCNFYRIYLFFLNNNKIIIFRHKWRNMCSIAKQMAMQLSLWFYRNKLSNRY